VQAWLTAVASAAVACLFLVSPALHGLVACVQVVAQVAHTSTLEAVLNAHVDTNLLRALLFDE
jgi:hypothetical protein